MSYLISEKENKADEEALGLIEILNAIRRGYQITDEAINALKWYQRSAELIPFKTSKSNTESAETNRVVLAKQPE